jgi:hypothetical protein
MRGELSTHAVLNTPRVEGAVALQNVSAETHPRSNPPS